MGRGASTLVLLLLALGFGGYLYFVDSKRPVTDANAKKKVFSYESDKITQIEMKSRTETTVLRKNGDNWSIVQPAQADADRASVNDVVTNVANLEEERVVDENAPDLKPYGLAEPRVDLTFNVEGEKQPRRILFGDKNPTGMGTYAKLPDNNRVFLVSTAVDTMLGKSAFDFRDKTALKFEQDKVTFVELASGSQSIRLEKSGEEWKLVKPVQAPADYISVNGLVGQLQSAQMTTLKDRPEDVKDLKPYGLDKPAVVATIGMGSAAAKFELGGAAEGGAYWARDPSKPAVFSVSSNLADELKKKADDFRRKEVFEFRPFNTTRFEILRGNQTRAFERVKGTGENAVDTWKQVLPAEKAVDASNFEGALLEFSNLRADGFVGRAGAQTGHNNPTATIAVKFDDGKKEERVVFGSAGGSTYATRPDQPGALKLESAKFDAAIKKLDAIQ